MGYLKLLWMHLVWEEKKLFKSSTLWLGYAMASAPVWLPYVQDNIGPYAQYIPAELRSPVMTGLGIAVCLCRLRSLLPPRPIST